MNNLVKRHEILKYIIDNEILIEPNTPFCLGKSPRVCICLHIAGNALSVYETRHSLVQQISYVLKRRTLRSWLYHEINYLPTDEELYEYRKLWLQAMYEACLKEDI